MGLNYTHTRSASENRPFVISEGGTSGLSSAQQLVEVTPLLEAKVDQTAAGSFLIIINKDEPFGDIRALGA